MESFRLNALLSDKVDSRQKVILPSTCVNMRGCPLTLWYLEDMAILCEVCVLTTQQNLPASHSGRHHNTAWCGLIRDQ